jgi:hypothetical protein
MRTLLISVVLLAGCSSSDNKTVDAAPSIDAAIDAPPVTLDCTSYCNAITANCTGANAQYPDTAHCMGACSKFAVGLASDTSGPTLGCHLYHAGTPAAGAPATHCIHAGPGGAQVNAAAGVCGDACTNFCAIQIAACGTAQYADMAACTQACAGFNKTNLYVLGGTPAAPAGDSLACRLYHATNAAISAANATTHCPHTAATPTGPCAGTAAP